MLRITPPLIIAAMLAMPLSARANVEKTFSWAFSTNSGSGTRCTDCSTNSSAATNGNVFQFQTSSFVDNNTGLNTTSNNVSVAGFSTTNDSNDPNSFETAKIRMWNGLGVISREDTDSTPHHSMDNDGGTTGYTDETLDGGDVDAALFSFDQAISLTSIKIGWTYSNDDEIISATNNDADISILAYTGTGTPLIASDSVNNKSFATLLAEGWEFVGHYANLLNNSAQNTIDTNGKTSSYWLISAFTSFADGNGNDTNGSDLDFGNDYFKIAGLGGKTITPDEPSSDIPEPTSLVLLSLGLIGWRIMTRNDRRSLNVAA